MEIVLQNIPENVALETWTTISLPQSTPNSIGSMVASNGDSFKAQIIDDVLYVKASIEKGRAIQGTYKPLEGPQKTQQFQFSNWVTDNLASLIPTFRAFKNNASYNSLPAPFLTVVADATEHTTLESSNPIRQRFKFQTRIPEVNLLIVGIFDIFTEQDIVPFEFTVHYTERNSQTIDYLEMEIGEEGIVDGAKLNNLETVYLGNSRWSIDLWGSQVFPSPDLKITGALLCRGSGATNLQDQARLINLKNRKEGRIVGKVK